MDDRTIVEREILRIIDKHDGEYSWYALELSMSNRDVPRIPSVRECLRDLEKRGLIIEVTNTKSEYTMWKITDDGIGVLQQLNVEKQI